MPKKSTITAKISAGATLLPVLAAVTMFSLVLAVAASAQTAGWISRYWDGCKPTCSWAQNVPLDSEYGLSRACDVNNKELFLGDLAEEKCYKDGGKAHSCWDQIPFVDPGNPLIAYGFGATSVAKCGECFEVTFTGEYENGNPMPMHRALASASSGKKLILMGRNTGGVGSNQIDFLVPGGGLGDFDCFSMQPGLNSSKMGARFGGLLENCIQLMIQQFGGNWSAPGLLEAAQACLRNSCSSTFDAPNHTLLLEGCQFYADWMMAAPNPKATVKKLDKCPQALVDRYKPESSKWTVMTKAMKFTSSTGSPSINTGNLTVSGINSQTTLTYNITAPYTGEYDLAFSVATMEQTTISIKVGDQPLKSVSFKTSDWGKFERVPLGSKVNLVQGNNTIVLSFQTNSVNFDYFIFVGEPQNVSVKHDTKAKTARANVAIKAGARGFTAILPLGHGYTSYSLIDLRGREVRRGKISAGAADLRLSNIRSGVLFLKLEGKNIAPAVLKTATY